MKRSSSQDTDRLARSAPESHDLSALQRWIAELIRHDRKLSNSAAFAEAAARHFSGSGQLDPAEQIDIYRQQFWLRHTSSLIEDFPGLTGIVGQRLWQRIVESYLLAHPLDARRLGHLGERLSAHLLTVPDLPHRKLCADMAALEWAYVDAFDDEDETFLDADKLIAIPAEDWPMTKLVVAPALRLLELEYPVADLRRTLRARQSDARQHTALQHSAAPTPLPDPDPHYLVVYRRQGRLWDKRVSRAAFLLLSNLKQKRPLGVACQQAVESAPDVESVYEQQLGAWFGLWGRLQWIVDVVPPQNTSNG